MNEYIKRLINSNWVIDLKLVRWKNLDQVGKIKRNHFYLKLIMIFLFIQGMLNLLEQILLYSMM